VLSTRAQSLLAGPVGRAFLGALVGADVHALLRAAGVADDGVRYGIRPPVARRSSRRFARDDAREAFLPSVRTPAHAAAVADLLNAAVGRERGR
jgi:hypothetical protein